MRNPFMMAPPDRGGKRHPSIQVALYLALSAAGGFVYQIGRWAWNWVMPM
ncbi:hypothetical protein ACFWAP_08935 [Streptomyces goshikiensis]